MLMGLSGVDVIITSDKQNWISVEELRLWLVYSAEEGATGLSLTKNKGSDLPKPMGRHFNLSGHSHEHMEICGINLHLGSNETRKRKEQSRDLGSQGNQRTIFICIVKHIFDQLDATNFK